MANDMTIIFGYLAFFILVGASMPFINAEFGTNVTEHDLDTLESNVGADIDSVTTVRAIDLIISVIKMFFWTFGDLWWWVDAFLLLIRVHFGVILARNVWIGGGA
jgi:hypothetical protein